ncbi:MAG: hypothetical protein R3F61_17170 [Myxococcota bacterium]
MRWLILLGTATLFAGSPAYAQAKKVEKAEKTLAKAKAGKPGLYAKAWDMLADAKEDPETRDDAKTWVLLAETAYQFVADPSLSSPVPEPWGVTWKAWDTAIGKGAGDQYAERALEGLATMEATASNQATNAYEAGRVKEAWDELQRAMRCQQLIRQVGTLDPARELASLKLALVVATELGKLDEARELHESLGKAGGARTGTTLAVARAIEDGEGVEAAATFLKPFAEASPDDATLFETYAGWLLELKRDDDVRALLTKHADQIGKAPAITLVHAQTWAALRDFPKATEAYEQALKVDGRNQDVLRGFADLSLAVGRDYGKQAAEANAFKERKSLRQKRDEALMKGMTLLQTSRELEPGHLPTLERLHEVYEEVELDDAEEIAALEQAIDAAREKAAKEAK